MTTKTDLAKVYFGTRKITRRSRVFDRLSGRRFVRTQPDPIVKHVLRQITDIDATCRACDSPVAIGQRWEVVPIYYNADYNADGSRILSRLDVSSLDGGANWRTRCTACKRYVYRYALELPTL